MTKFGLPKSVRKFIRLEKARIRRQFWDAKKQEEMINELYKRFLAQPKTEVVKEAKQEKVEEEKEPAFAEASVGKEKTKEKVKSPRYKKTQQKA